MLIVGIMPVYEEADWIEYAVEGIIDFVDELVIAEGYQGPAWHFDSCRSKDGTIDIIKRLAKKYDKITLTECQPRAHVLRGKAATHNHVLKVSRLIKKADWYMICDSDEFYTDTQKKYIRGKLASTEKDAFAFSARVFFFNFQYHINHILPRLFRVTKRMEFRPGQFPYYGNGRPYYEYPDNTPCILLGDDPIFHYSFAKRPSQEIKRRTMEYCAVQREKHVFDWIDKIYLKWSPENSEEIYKLNKKMFGWDGIVFSEEQRLQVYKGRHPSILDHHPFRYLADVREEYKLTGEVGDYIKKRHHFAHILMRILQRVSSVTRSFKSKIVHE